MLSLIYREQNVHGIPQIDIWSLVEHTGLINLDNLSFSDTALLSPTNFNPSVRRGLQKQQERFQDLRT